MLLLVLLVNYCTDRRSALAGGIGIGYTFYQTGTNQVSVGEGMTDVGFGIVGFFGVPGLIIAGGYFLDKTLTEHSHGYRDYKRVYKELYQYEKKVVTTPDNWYYPPGPCFAAGTKVLLDDGELKNIENIIVGNSVPTFNIEKSVLERGIVSKIFKHTVDKIYEVRVSNEKFIVTAEHPFFVIDKGWVKVVDLQAGNLLMTYDRNKTKVKSKELLDKSTEVFNIHVDGNHIYFVGAIQILVHNK